MEQLKLAFQFKHQMLPTDILNLCERNSVVIVVSGIILMPTILLNG